MLCVFLCGNTQTGHGGADYTDTGAPSPQGLEGKEQADVIAAHHCCEGEAKGRLGFTPG